MLLNDRYEPHERIGEGGMALVYRATDRRLGREVAVKMLRPQYAGDADFVARFQQEAQSAARLSHPSIAAVFDTGHDQGHHYIVMELLKPFTLKDLIARSSGGRLEVEQAVRFAVEMARALAHAHKHGVVHRDIKPQNILFTDDGHVKVSDFGIARALAVGSSTATGTILGSPHYISPEQARGESAGPASDLYSLGVVLYEMLTGTTPYGGETPVAVAVQHLRGTPRSVSELRPDVPAPVAAVVERAMAREPAARFGSAVELAEALEAALRGQSPAPIDELAETTVMPRQRREPAEVLVPQRTEPRGGLSPGLVALLVLGVLLAGGIGVVMGRRDASQPEVVITPGGEEAPRRQIVVPDLVGKDVAGERARLDQYYRQQEMDPPQIVEAGYEDSAEPQDRILRQEPPAGSTILEGDVIRVWLSTGIEQVPVPDLTGLTLNDADRALTRARLFQGAVKYEHSEEYRPDVVIRQSVKPGETAPAGSGIDVVISLGPEEQAPEEPVEPDQPPTQEYTPPDSGARPSVAVSSPEAVDGGLKVARVTVSLPADGPGANVELKWISGGTGVAAGGQVGPGATFMQEVRGTPGAVLGVYVDGELLKSVEY